MKVAIIGGGLAGTSCAYVLKRAGIEAVIYEAGAEIAPAASGNALGLYNPRLSALRTAESDYYSAAFRLALEIFSVLGEVGWNRCGALHLMTDKTRQKRFAQTAESWGWAKESMRIVDAGEASNIAGVELRHGALWLPDSGVVSPRKLCAAYADGAKIHFNAKVKSEDVKADAVIIACGVAAKDFGLPVNTVRGQLTFVKPSTRTTALKTNLCYGGYFSPAVEGQHALGATFQRWLDHNQIIEEDDADNIAKLAEVAPELVQDLEVVGRRAAVRASTKDHFPIAGQLAENLYVSAGHGSHGILSTLAAAQLIAEMIAVKKTTLSVATIEKLSPQRFA